MLKLKSLTALMLAASINYHCGAQAANSTQTYAADLKKLIELNSPHPGSLDLSGPEAINLSNATASQIIAITVPYHHSTIANAKEVCFYLLSRLLYEKTESHKQKQEVVEIICGNYLANERELQSHDLVLLQLQEKDFNTRAKKYIAALVDSIPGFSHSICAQLSAVAQIKKNIPIFWNLVNKDTARMQGSDIDVLASLARLGEKEAALLLCNFYKNASNKPDRPGVGIMYYVIYAKQLAFSLDQTILECLIADLRSFDLNIKQPRWWPGQHLGMQIASMLKNYPYPKEYKLDPHQLLAWLNSTNKYDLNEK